MTFAEQLKQMAIEIANDIQMSALQRKPELEKAKLVIAQIQAQLDAANLAFDRIKSFVPEVGGNFQCPRCWVASEKRFVLNAMGGGGEGHDYFICHNCNSKFEVYE